ncbi:co-chaperone GroES [bacterium]|nr:co-chaperone GroES [bacterium]
MKIMPLGNRVLIEPQEEEQKTESGIVLPDTAEKEKSQIGKVLAVGKGEAVKKLKLKKNDLVVLDKFGPTEVEIEEKKYLLAEPTHILALLK